MKDFFYIFDFQLLFMKKIYTLVLFISFFIGNAQIINIPDANFKAKLLQASSSNNIALDTDGQYIKIDINNDGEIQENEALNVFELDVSYSNIQDMTGIEAFINLTSLKCSTNQLTSLDITQNTALTFLSLNQNLITSLDLSQNLALEFLFYDKNQLTNLDVTQNTALTYLSLNENQLTSLDVSQNLALTALSLNQNQLTSLDISQNIALDYLSCGSNQLTSLDVTQNIALETLSCSNIQLTSLDVTQNVALENLFCNGNQLTSLDVTQNIALRGLYCINNELNSLDFSQNVDLETLYCSNNQLTYLNIKNNNQFWNNLNFDVNPNLEYVCVNENDLAMVQQKIIDYGYTNCHANTYCSFVPGGLFYTIQGDTKYDSNNNGCDDSDINYSNLNFTISNGIESGTLITNTSGNYLVPIQEGSYSITPVLESPSYYTITPTSVSTDFPSETSPFIQNFCITPNGIHYDLEVTVLPITPSRPGFNSTFKILYKNKGTQIQSGSILFTYDNTLMDFVSCSPNSYNQTTNFINMNYLDLMPTEVREFIIILNINSPMETPPVNAGDDLGFDAIILPIENDEVPADNHSQIKVTAVNSYDPNDKTCLEGNTISPEMVGEYVHYVIRFENTGTFAAENVVIADIIDATKFEINTLIPQSSSHDFFTRINGNKVEFIFENINLPFDDENNDGYVAFKIKTKSNLVVGDELTNTASIYFDYNFPIITNTTSTTIEEPLSNQDFDFETNFTLYPNPAKDVLNIKTKSEMDVKSVSIYNTLGQIIMTTIHAENGEINVSNLQSGSYFIKVFTDKGSSTAKFIKQ